MFSISTRLFWEHYINDISQYVAFRGRLFLLKKLSKLLINSIAFPQFYHGPTTLPFILCHWYHFLNPREDCGVKDGISILWKASNVTCITSLHLSHPTVLPGNPSSSDSTSVQNCISFHASANSLEGACYLVLGSTHTPRPAPINSN